MILTFWSIKIHSRHFFSLLKDWFPEGWDHRWKNEVQWVKYLTVCDTPHDSLPWYWKVSRLTLFSNYNQILNDNLHFFGALMGLCCQDLRGNTLEYHKQNLSVLKLRSFIFSLSTQQRETHSFLLYKSFAEIHFIYTIGTTKHWWTELFSVKSS